MMHKFKKIRRTYMIAVNIYYSGTNGSARKFAQEMIDSGTVQKIIE